MNFEWWLDGTADARESALVCPPSGARWWTAPTGARAFSTGNDAWLEVEGRWLRASVSPEVIWHEANAWWFVVEGQRWRVDRSGAHLVPIQRPARPARLPPRLHPAGDGVVWAADGFVYRSVEGRLECLHAHGSFAVGPAGATLIGDTTHWRSFAPPGRPSRPLDPPIRREDDWGFRWSDTGERVAGLDGDGEPRTWTPDGMEPGSRRPTDADGSHIRGGTLVHYRHGPIATGLGRATVGRSGTLLAGAGHRLWDLATGLALRPIRPGTVLTVGASEGHFLAIDEDAVRWFDRECDGPRYTLDPALREVADAWPIPGGVCIETVEGLRARVSREGVELGGAPRSEPPHRPAGVRIRSRYLQIDGTRWEGLRVHEAARVGACVWAWSRSGLLLRFA